MKASEFISSLNDLDPDYVGVPEGVDLSGIDLVRVTRTSSSTGYVHPDGVYYDRDSSRFEELTTEVAE